MDNIMKSSIISFINVNDEKMPVEIIKSEKVPEKEKKALNKDTSYKFESEIIEDKLILRLVEINSYSPYFFEECYTLEDLQNGNCIFKSCSDLETVKRHLIALFGEKKTELILNESVDDEKNKTMIIKLLAFDISRVVEIKFELKLKMVSTKDESLMFLYRIEKEKNSLLKQIRQICRENKGNKEIEKILQLLDEEEKKIYK